VFILKGVKVVCFDTLLQVLILKVVSGAAYRVRIEGRLFTTKLAEGAEVGGAAEAGRDRLGWPKLM
jgi:hypothetical protein